MIEFGAPPDVGVVPGVRVVDPPPPPLVA